MRPLWSFYPDGLDLSTQGIVGTEFEDGAVLFFTMNDGLILALYPRVALARDGKAPSGAPSRLEMCIGDVVNDD